MAFSVYHDSVQILKESKWSRGDYTEIQQSKVEANRNFSYLCH